MRHSVHINQAQEMRDSKIPELRQAEQTYIAEHHGNTTVPDMAAHLKRGAATIYAYMKEKKLPVFRAPRARWHGKHPFRQKNRELEQVVKLRQIENRGKPYDGRHY